VEKKVHFHGLHAAVLHLLGFDYKRLTYKYAGRDFRLTDVHGEVVESSPKTLDSWRQALARHLPAVTKLIPAHLRGSLSPGIEDHTGDPGLHISARASRRAGWRRIH